MWFEEVGDLVIHVILSKLNPQDVAAVACVSKSFKVWASDESLWHKFCFHELQLSAPEDPHGNILPSFKATYSAWRVSFCMYPWPLVKRVKRCWAGLKTWLSNNFPEALATLRKGCSEENIKELEKILKVQLPLSTRVLYRFCDGQELTAEGTSKSRSGITLGLIGGYTFYNHSVNVYLLSLSQAVVETKEFVRSLGFSRRYKYVVVAASTIDEKVFFLNCSTGQLHVGTRYLHEKGEMMACVPEALIDSVHHINASQQQDAMLLWLEEHGRRLQDGIIKIRDEGGIRSISLFPEIFPLCSTAVTNGVQVRASAVFVPELGDLQNLKYKYMFAYSIRMSLLREGCIIDGTFFSSCQLYRRHWIIRANSDVVGDTGGEAVIGKFPLLFPGKGEFVYESCTHLSSSHGSMEGAFTFIPGRLDNPKGRPFEAEVALFPLEVPGYIF